MHVYSVIKIDRSIDREREREREIFVFDTNRNNFNAIFEIFNFIISDNVVLLYTW